MRNRVRDVGVDMSEAPKRVWVTYYPITGTMHCWSADDDDGPGHELYVSTAALREAIETSVTKGDALDAIEKLLEGKD